MKRSEMVESDTEYTGERTQTSSTMANTTVSGGGTNSSRDVPKLKTSDCEDYEVWRNFVRWWSRLTRIPKDRQAPHIIINGLLHKDLRNIANQVDVDIAETDEGLKVLLQKLDEHFLPNTFVRKMELWKTFRDKRKTSELSCDDFLQEMRTV